MKEKKWLIAGCFLLVCVILAAVVFLTRPNSEVQEPEPTAVPEVTETAEGTEETKDVLAAIRENGKLTIAGAQYSGKVPDLVSNFKYSGLRYLSKPLARFITEHPEFPVLAPHIYALVPVPLHFLKEFARGFNQAEDLAYSLSAASGIPVIRALKRTRLNRPQASLSMESRKANLSGAFAFRESQRARFASIGKNQLVALVDDVCTTGTTAELCARALKKAGLRNIILLCAAKT